VKRKDLCAWESEYGGTTAEGIAKRVINKYNPSFDDVSIPVHDSSCSVSMDGIAISSSDSDSAKGISIPFP
jgi:LEA14-like dessication related protein